MTEQRADKASGIYIHIPFCRSKCKYCAFVSTPDLSLQHAYVKTLLREISSCTNGGAADSVYIGGGTPSCLYNGALEDILRSVHSAFGIGRDGEITVECNPESVTADFIYECKNCGVNRISLGMQSSDDAVLKKIGRAHDFACYKRAIDMLSRHFDNISTDIIIGLPGQTAEDMDRSISVASDHCSHISVYALSVEDGTPLFSEGYRTADDDIADMYDRALPLLERYGFERYEVSNFAKKGRQSRHNNKYWNCEPYFGFGAAAHGYDGEYIRYSHSDDICSYISDPSVRMTVLSEKDLYNEYVMLRLRTSKGIDIVDFRKRFGYCFRDRNSAILTRLAQENSIVMTETGISISPDRMFVMNGIIEELMTD